MNERDKVIEKITGMLGKIADVECLKRIYRFVQYIYIHVDGREAS